MFLETRRTELAASSKEMAAPAAEAATPELLVTMAVTVAPSAYGIVAPAEIDRMQRPAML
jgi:hypothetical protein